MEKIYDKYADLLYRLALVNLGNEADAEDAVQDVFIKYLQAQPRFKDENHQEGWFVRVTVNTCKDFLRKKKHRSYTPLDDIHHLKSEDNEENAVEQTLSVKKYSGKGNINIVVNVDEGETAVLYVSNLIYNEKIELIAE